MDILESAFLPLGAFWVALQTLQASASFTNGLRETIVTGKFDGEPLTPEHRKAIQFDWVLSVVGTVIVLLLFSGVIFWIAAHI